MVEGAVVIAVATSLIDCNIEDMRIDGIVSDIVNLGSSWIRSGGGLRSDLSIELNISMPTPSCLKKRTKSS